MSFAVQIQNLDFAYKNQSQLISNLRLNVAEGIRFGIFGPNGAGKTTLMSLICGLLHYSRGSIKIFDV
jgi:ABC-2 type transport system ATP-binding protein